MFQGAALVHADEVPPHCLILHQAPRRSIREAASMRRLKILPPALVLLMAPLGRIGITGIEVLERATARRLRAAT